MVLTACKCLVSSSCLVVSCIYLQIIRNFRYLLFHHPCVHQYFSIYMTQYLVYLNGLLQGQARINRLSYKTFLYFINNHGVMVILISRYYDVQDYTKDLQSYYRVRTRFSVKYVFQFFMFVDLFFLEIFLFKPICVLGDVDGLTCRD